MLGFSDSADTTDTGTDVEFHDIPAVLTSAAHTFPFTPVIGETLVVESSDDGGAT